MGVQIPATSHLNQIPFLGLHGCGCPSQDLNFDDFMGRNETSLIDKKRLHLLHFSVPALLFNTIPTCTSAFNI